MSTKALTAGEVRKGSWLAKGANDGQESHSPLELGGTGDTHVAFLRAFLLSTVRTHTGLKTPCPLLFPPWTQLDMEGLRTRLRLTRI